MLLFTEDGVDVATPGTAFFVLRVSDEVARDWTATVPLAILK